MTQHTGKCHVPAERLREILDALGMAPTRDWDDVLNAARCLSKNASAATGQAREPDAATLNSELGVAASRGDDLPADQARRVALSGLDDAIDDRAGWYELLDVDDLDRDEIAAHLRDIRRVVSGWGGAA